MPAGAAFTALLLFAAAGAALGVAVRCVARVAFAGFAAGLDLADAVVLAPVLAVLAELAAACVWATAWRTMSLAVLTAVRAKSVDICVAWNTACCCAGSCMACRAIC